MTKYEILAEFVKDISSETKDIQTYLFVKDYISKYQLTIDINSQPTKNKLIEVSTFLKFEDKENNEKKSYFEIVYATVIKLTVEIKDKKELEKIKDSHARAGVSGHAAVSREKVFWAVPYGRGLPSAPGAEPPMKILRPSRYSKNTATPLTFRDNP